MLTIHPHKNRGAKQGIHLRVSREQYAELLKLAHLNQIGVGAVVQQMVEHCLEELSNSKEEGR